jgi:hypothetical protein
MSKIIEHMVENNSRFLTKSNGIWRQLLELEVRQFIQRRIYSKDSRVEVIIEKPKTKSCHRPWPYGGKHSSLKSHDLLNHQLLM